MASQLVNLRRALTWHDFGHPRPGPDPAPGVVAVAAQTRVTHSHTIAPEHVPGTHPPAFRIRDNVSINVVLQQQQMFVNAWVFRQPQNFQDAILHHEQGHYDLVALFCRDMFLEIMALKTQTFSSGNGPVHAVQQIFGRFDPLIAQVHRPYDDDTRHGRNATQQARWDRFIQAAFTQARTPPESAPDGTPYKVRLLDCLRAGSVAI